VNKEKYKIKYLIVMLSVIVVMAIIYLPYAASKEKCDINIIAYVNDAPIYKEKVDRYIGILSKYSSAENGDIKKFILNELINSELIYQKSREKYGMSNRSEAIENLLNIEIGKPHKGNETIASIQIEKERQKKYNQLIFQLRKNANIIIKRGTGE